MKKLKKLELKKEVIARISNDEMNHLRGGAVTVTDNLCPPPPSTRISVCMCGPTPTPTPKPTPPEESVAGNCHQTSDLFNTCKGYTC